MTPQAVSSIQNDECEMMNDEWKNAPRVSPHSSFIIHSSLASPPTAYRRLPTAHPGFTLVELMVTIIIIAILAALFLGALAQARQAANIANTQALINKLHGQIMLRYESYRTRRLPIEPLTWDPGAPLPSTPQHALILTPHHAAAHRLAALRELMRLELPDRWTDVTDDPIVFKYAPYPHLPGLSNPFTRQRAFLTPTGTPLPHHTAINDAYRKRYNDARNALQTTMSGAAADALLRQYEDAECLYLIVTTAHSDDVAGNEQFRDGDIGDADGDGLPEFHDAWGNPIHFLRWAPGLVSDMQPLDASSADPRRVDKNHDPFDPLRLHSIPTRDIANSPPNYLEEGFALQPLVYSAGPDRAADLCHGPTDTQGQEIAYDYNLTKFSVGDYDATNNKWYYYDFRHNPYQLVPVYVLDARTQSFVSQRTQIGAPLDVDGDGTIGDADNIHNHALGPQ